MKKTILDVPVIMGNELMMDYNAERYLFKSMEKGFVDRCKKCSLYKDCCKHSTGWTLSGLKCNKNYRLDSSSGIWVKCSVYKVSDTRSDDEKTMAQILLG
jgi:hypothetical protein